MGGTGPETCRRFRPVPFRARQFGCIAGGRPCAGRGVLQFMSRYIRFREGELRGARGPRHVADSGMFLFGHESLGAELRCSCFRAGYLRRAGGLQHLAHLRILRFGQQSRARDLPAAPRAWSRIVVCVCEAAQHSGGSHRSQSPSGAESFACTRPGPRRVGARFMLPEDRGAVRVCVRVAAQHLQELLAPVHEDWATAGGGLQGGQSFSGTTGPESTGCETCRGFRPPCFRASFSGSTWGSIWFRASDLHARLSFSGITLRACLPFFFGPSLHSACMPAQHSQTRGPPESSALRFRAELLRAADGRIPRGMPRVPCLSFSGTNFGQALVYFREQESGTPGGLRGGGVGPNPNPSQCSRLRRLRRVCSNAGRLGS